MVWGFSQGSKLFALLPALFLLLLVLNSSGTNETGFPPAEENLSGFQEVEDYLNITDSQQNETTEDFIDIKEFLNFTAGENETNEYGMEGPEEFPGTNETQENETILFFPENLSGENQAGFMDVDEFLNETEPGENETAEEFMEVGEFLNAMEGEPLPEPEEPKPVKKPSMKPEAPPGHVVAEGKVLNALGQQIKADIIFNPESKGKSRYHKSSTEDSIFIPKGRYDITITPRGHPIEEILINNFEIDGDLPSLVYLDTPPKDRVSAPPGVQFNQLYVFNPQAGISGTFTVRAQGTIVYKCKEWDFYSRVCMGEWVPILKVTPGELYTIDFNPSDPAYGEGSDYFVLTTITLDGDFTDWEAVLANERNTMSDGISGINDLDVVGTPNRDLLQYAFTWDEDYYYSYFRRTASGTNVAQLLLYIDANNDNKLGTTDYVIRYSWRNNQGVDSFLYNYTPAIVGGDPITGDGQDENGTVSNEVSLESNLPGRGPNGIIMETRLNWSAIGLQPGAPFGLHVSSSLGTNLPSQLEDNMNAIYTLINDIDIEPDRSCCGANGKTVSYNHTVTNLGNAYDTVNVNTSGTTPGFTVNIYYANGTPIADTNGDSVGDTGPLAPGGTINITVNITIAGASSGDVDYTYVVATSGNNTNISDSALDTTYIGDVVIFPTESGRIINGSTIFYNHTVGSYLPGSEVIDIIAISNNSYVVNLTYANGTPLTDTNNDSYLDIGNVTPGVPTYIQVWITVPAAAALGTIDLTKVTVLKATDFSVNSSVTDTTTVSSPIEIFPNRTGFISVGAGDYIFYQHTVRNSLNVTDAGDLTYISSQGWNATFYAEDMFTPLTDTDGDGIVDTGNITRFGGTKTIYVKLSHSGLVTVNTTDITNITVNSSVYTSESDQVTDNTTARILITYENAIHTIFEDTFDKTQTVYANSYGLGAYNKVYYLWYDSNGILQRMSPDIDVDTDDEAQDLLPLNYTLPSGQYLVYLHNAQNDAEITQEFFYVFGIPNVTVIIPNGGENWSGTNLAYYNVTDESGKNITAWLQYSSNGGVTWNNITTQHLNTTNCTYNASFQCVEGQFNYSWDTTTVPDGISYLVRIIADNTYFNGTDDSDAVFTIDNTGPTVTLNAPPPNFVNESTPSANVTFNCSATDAIGLKNISLYITDSSNSSFSFNQSTPLSGASGSAQWELELQEGVYSWNCLAYDIAGNSDWGDANRSLTIGNKISSCAYLSVPNANYTLTANLFSNKSDSVCLTINASNITLDCAGFNITGVGGSTSGIAILNSSGARIENCIVGNYSSAFLLQNANNSYLRNNTGFSSEYGMLIDPSYNNTIIENQFFNNSMYGLYLEDSHNNTIRNNSAFNNSDTGVYLHESTYNNLTNNNAYNNTNSGFFMWNSSYTVFWGNAAWDNGDFGGFYFTMSDYNIMENNTANSQNIGFQIFDSVNNKFTDNLAYDNNGGFYFFNSTNSSLTDNTAHSSIAGDGFSITHSNYSKFINNTAYNNSHSGFDVHTQFGTLLENNTAYNNSNGYTIMYCQGNQFISNAALNNSAYGYYIWFSDANEFDKNSACNTSGTGFFLYNSQYNNLTNGASLENTLGFDIRSVDHSLFINNTVGNYTGSHGFYSSNLSHNVFSYNRAYGGNNGFFFLIGPYENNSFIGNEVYDNQNGFFLMHLNFTYLADNVAHDNSQMGFSINGNYTNFVNNTASNSSLSGISIIGKNITIFNSTSHGNGVGLSFSNSAEVAITKMTMYNNAQYDFSPYNASYSMEEGLFLNPAGTFVNYTNLSILDAMGGDEWYRIKWTTNSSALPMQAISFEQKFINVSRASGIVSIEEITWHWLDSELPGYDESLFELWKYNSSGWLMLNNTPDTANNWIKQYNMDPASDYGILQKNEFLFIENLTLNPNLSIDYFNDYNYTVDVINSSTIDKVNLTYVPINGDGGSCHAFYVNGSCAGDSPTTVLMSYLSGNAWYRPHIRPDNIYPQVQFGDDDIYWYNSPSFVDLYKFNYHIFHFINNYTINSNASFWIEFDARSKPSTNVNLQVYLFDNTTTIADFQSNWLGNPKGELVATIGPGTPKHHVHTTNSTHYLITLTADASGNIGTTSRPVNGNFWIVLYSVTPSSNRAWNLSIRDGSLCNTTNWWTGTTSGWGTTQVLTGCPDAHLHVARYTGGINDGVNATSCANLTSGFSNCTSTVDYFGNIPNLPPVPNDITSPMDNNTYFCPLNITWNQFIDPNGDAVTYNVSLLDANGTFIQTIVGSTSNTYYEWDCSGVPNGIYKINVKGTDTGGLSSNTTMDGNFTLFSNCPIIELPGEYNMSSNFIGAPNSLSNVPDISRACIIIASPNVTFSCNGYNITNNGTLDAVGAVINGSASLNYTNVTIRNCPGISGYEVGLEVYGSSQDAVQNISSYNNSIGIELSSSQSTMVETSSAYNNSQNGFYILQSDNNNITGSNSYLNSGSGFTLSSSLGNVLMNNSAHSNFDSGAASGFSTQNSEYNIFIGNLAYNNTQHGFSLSSSNHTNLHNNSAYNNSFDGIQLLYNCTHNNLTENLLFDNLQNGIWLDVRSSFNRLENNTAYDNALSGIQLTDLSNNNTLANNTAYDNANGFALTIGFNLALPVSNNTLRSNRAYNNTNGYVLDSNASLNLLENNLAYENDDGFSLSSAYNNTFIGIHSYNNTYNGFILSGGDGNSFTNITSENNTDDGFYALDSSNITIDPSKLKNNGANGVNLNNCEDILLENVTVNDNKGHGLHMVNVERSRILTSEFCNNHQYGIRLHHSLDTNISNSLICNNSEYGIRSDDSNNTRSFSNEITNNTLTGVYLDSASNSNTFNDTFICFNGFDVFNASALSLGALDTCDSYENWTENNHPGCTFRCTDIWHYFYGNISGNLLLAPNQADLFYSWAWNGQEGNVYVISGNASIDWASLVALGRNTTQQNSTNDFTELDSLLGISAEPDNVNYTFSYDGSNPRHTINATVYEHFAPYVPVANVSLFTNNTLFGILWDSSQGGPQFNTSLNQDVVFGTGIEGSGTYQYEIRVPETLATYKGGDVVEFWVELD